MMYSCYDAFLKTFIGVAMLVYTEDEYRGYIVEYATSKANEAGKWMGHYRVRKDGHDTFHASIANLQVSEPLAEGIAMRFARDHVNNQQFTEGDVGTFELITPGDYVACEVFVDGEWRRAQISGTTLKVQSGLDERADAIAKIRPTVGRELLAAAPNFLPPDAIRI